MLPWPLGLVEDLNRNKHDLADFSDDRLSGFLENDSPLLRPLGPLLSEDSTPLFIEFRFGFGFLICRSLGSAHDAASDHLHHLVCYLTKSASSATATAAASAVASLLMLMVLSRRGVLILGFLFLGLIDGGDNHRWGEIRSSDLDEGVLVSKSVLADLAVVEVQANRALVSNTKYRTCPAAVTSNVLMGFQLKFLVNDVSALVNKVFALDEL